MKGHCCPDWGAREQVHENTFHDGKQRSVASISHFERRTPHRIQPRRMAQCLL